MARGSIRRRSGVWEIRWEDPPDEHGHRVQRSEGGHKTKKAAVAALNRKLATLVKGPAEQASKMPVEECCTLFLKERTGKGLRPSTVRLYEIFFRLYLLPLCGDTQLASVDRDVLQQVIQRMIDGGLRASTIGVKHTYMQGLFNWCVEAGFLPATPVRSLSLPEVSPKRPVQILDVPEIAQFLAVFEGTEFWLPAYLGLHTGMRPGEILGLSWDDVNLAEGSLSVTHTLHRISGGGFRLGPPKTKASVRSVAVAPEVVDVLRGLEQRKPDHFWYQRGRKLGHRGVLHDAVPVEFRQLCARPEGEILTYESWSDASSRMLCRAGWRAVPLHNLRHTHVSLLLLAGESMLVVSKRIGHASVETTMKEYAHLLPSSDPGAAALFANLLRKGFGGFGGQNVGRGLFGGV